ncbi:MAG: hypothetical protein KKE46_06040 [Gammaproteobacteria bacterium]|nr:hypothetical protein [Gammaproteobacteria bacterium]
MLFLKHSPSLCDFQNYVHALEIERGFAHENLAQKCLLLGEEIGELCEAIRQYASQSVNSVAGELADVLIILFSMANRLRNNGCLYNAAKALFIVYTYQKLAEVLLTLCQIANRFQLNLETLFREKEAINKTRKWQV